MIRSRFLRLVGGGLAFFTIVVPIVKAQEYKFDSRWPRLPLPEKWWLQDVTGLDVDHDDVVWILNRPSAIGNNENYAQLTPPTGDCCVAAPAVVALDQAGDVVYSWDTDSALWPRLHGLAVDRAGHVWIGAETVYKFTREGELLDRIDRVSDATTPPRGFRPDTEAVVGQIEDIKIDEEAREIYYVDNYLNGRIMVHDLDTLQFKRGWGAYGKPLSAISMQAGKRTYNVTGPPARDFLGHVTLGISNDGLVYAADRAGNRIQIFTKVGIMLEEFYLAPETLHRGSAGGIAFSADTEQGHLLVPDLQNNTVWVLNRENGEILRRISSAGDFGGQFNGLHVVDVDSLGNLYTGEVYVGRVQRFSTVN